MKKIIISLITIMSLALASCTFASLQNVHSSDLSSEKLSKEKYKEENPHSINSIHFTNKPHVIDGQGQGYVKPCKMIWQQNTSTNEWTVIKVKVD